MARKSLKERDMDKRCEACSGLGTLKHALDLCDLCAGTGIVSRRCRQCWKWQSIDQYISARGETFKLVVRCHTCTEKYKNWSDKPLEERESATYPRARIRADGPLRVKFVVESGNRKTGPIPVSMTSAGTCPKTCSWYGRGCYAEQHMVSIHWRRVSEGQGLEWDEFVKRVQALPDGQIWRHNEAGDLPGDGKDIDPERLRQLVRANAGKRGFTYTHYKYAEAEFMYNHFAIRHANQNGFAVNISADTLEEADLALSLGHPAVVVLPLDAPIRGNKTPAGHNIVVCPAEWSEKVTCERCGLCSVIGRKSVIGFRAHGDRKSQMSERISKRQLPLFQEAPVDQAHSP